MSSCEEGRGGLIPYGGDEVGDGKVFFPGEKLVKWTVLDGYLYGGAAVCTGQLCVDGGEILIREF